MLSRKKITGILIAAVIIVFVAIFANQAIRKSFANDNVAQYKEDSERIRNNPKYYDANSKADKGLLIDAMRYDDKNYQAVLLYAGVLHELC